jgi:hypothetical protein
MALAALDDSAPASAPGYGNSAKLNAYKERLEENALELLRPGGLKPRAA